MEIPVGMRRSAIVILLMLLTGYAAAQTELYDRYSEMPGVKVASVTGFTIDSVTHVDVTVVEAQDDEGWQWMKQEFYIADLSAQQEQSVAEGYDAVLFARRSRVNPRDNAPIYNEHVDVAASCYIGVSYLSRTVYIFCANSEEEYDAVAALLIKKIMHSSR